ncbi:hypothetical protein N5P37_010649 [Trichoderma harzianum]|nr:hypothetical protein N5P37_010649 [Trichoderma harzianum]
MDSKYESILLSKPFTFIVGPHKKQYIMHEAAVSRLSKTLDQLLHGGMRESEERCVCWEDLDEKTFLRFGEWTYTGDYKPEEPEILLDASQITSAEAKDSEENPKSEPICPSLAAISARVAVRIPNKQKVITTFTSGAKYKSPTTSHEARKNTESCEDYSEVFLSHALLYTLADKYDIPELSQLSIHKLYVTLKEFTIYEDRIGDIVGLVKYSFKNTIPGDKLRALMVEYCTCIVEGICNSKEFQDLINEAPEFASELIKEMVKRLD